MATKEAAIRVNLNGGAFLSGLRGLTSETQRAGRAMGRALGEPMSKGFDSAKRSFNNMASNMKRGLATVATLGGAVSLGAFARDAIEMERATGRVAMKLRNMGQAGASVASTILVAKTAGESFQATTQDMLTAYEMLLDDTGDPVFSQRALESVALMKNAMRVTTEQAAGMVGAFADAGMSADVIEKEMLPAVMSLGTKGGFKLDQLTDSAGTMAKVMIANGLASKDGFGMLAGMVNLSDGAGEAEQRINAVGKMLLKLRGGKALEDMGKKLRLPGLKNSTDQIKNMQAILARPGGFKMLQNMFGKSTATAGVFAKLTEPYVKAVEDATTQGVKADAAIELAATAFGKSLEEATRVTTNESKVRDEATRAAEEKGAQFERAIGRMKDAFMDEKFLNAMTRLTTDVLPKVTDAFVKVVDFASEHPVMAAAALPAANIASSFAAGALGSGLKAGWEMLKGKLGGAAAAAAASKAAAMSAETAAQAAARVAGGFGESLLTNSAGSAVGSAVGGATSGTVAGTVAGAGMAATAITAGVVAGVAGIAAMGALGVSTINANDRLDTIDTARKVANGTSGADYADTPELRAAAMRALHEQRKKVSEMGEGNFLFESLVESQGGTSTRQIKAETTKLLDDAIAKLTASMERAAAQQDALAKSANEAAGGVTKLGGAATNVAKPHSTRGPRRAPQPGSGAGNDWGA